jgi:hypothetical protein
LKPEKTGFKVEIQSGVDLVVGQQAVVDLKLEVGQVQQQVTVTGEVANVFVLTVVLKAVQPAVKRTIADGL